MRALGVDLGTERVGLALGDDLGLLATPLETVFAKEALARITTLVAEHKVGVVVLGLPRNMDGSYGPAAEAARRFGETLAARTPAHVEFWDERLTTRAVERMLVGANLSRKRRREVVDKLAAQQILQSWLDAQEVRRTPPEAR
ncbi:MAG: Holliday junction resolvase RuvX [Verrucomicrobiae bacterium]|nr:Holliday junction resolvase RuvX [Verrucomicrobiae bacterium]